MIDNPLLALSDGVERIAFSAITAEHVEPSFDILLAEARASLTAIERDTTSPSYASTFGALDQTVARLNVAFGVIQHIEAVGATDAFREAFNRVQPKIAAFYARIPLSAALFARLSTLDTKSITLTAPEARHVALTLREFRRNGANLSEGDKAKVLAIDVALSERTTRYAQNTIDASNAWALVLEDRQALAGIPEDAVEAMAESARSKGVAGYRLTLASPVYLAVLTYATDRSLRERVYRAYSTTATRAPNDNRPLIAEILALRAQRARVLGFANYADYVLEERMAQRSARAIDFVEEIHARTKNHFAKETRELKAFRCEVEGPGAPALEPWDLAFYADRLNKARYEFDEDALRPYFAVESVQKGMFEIVKRLYGVDICRWVDAPVWHEAVQAYEMRSREGAVIGRFYLDLFPRERKRDGAWMHGLVHGMGGRPHLGIIVANMTAPVGDKPALLTRREVETLFHEFGHLLHHCFSEVPIRSLAGTNVPTDFVELPSMIMENWVWDEAALDLFARHHATGEPIAREWVARMLRSRKFRAASALMRQLGFASLDLRLHTTYCAATDGDVTLFARALMSEFAAATLPPDYAMIASFSHLFADSVGYAAGYYSYLWSEQLAADAFQRFRDEGIFSREAGSAFRDAILSRGNSEEPLALYMRFTGHEPSLEPLFERLGLGGLPP
jgi:oligopeptidase A